MIYLSSLRPTAANPGDFSNVAPISIDEGATPLAVAALDADMDGDVDLFVIPGPKGQISKKPFILFNRGDGVLDEPEARSEINMPSGVNFQTTGWKTIPKLVGVGKVGGYGGDSIVFATQDDTTGTLVIVQPNGASPSSTISAPADWTLTNNIQVFQVGSGITSVLVADYLPESVGKGDEILVSTINMLQQYYSPTGSSVMSSDSKANLSPSTNTAASVAVGQVDADMGGFADVVYCGVGRCTVLYGSDANGNGVTALASRDSSTNAAAYTVDSQWEWLNVLVEDVDING